MVRMIEFIPCSVTGYEETDMRGLKVATGYFEPLIVSTHGWLGKDKIEATCLKSG
jgi:hypothetical protein